MKKFFTDPTYRIEAVVFSLAILFAAPLIVYAWLQPWAHRYTSDGIGIAAFPTVFLAGILIFGCVCFAVDYRAFGRGVVPPEGDVSGMNWPSTVAASVVAILSPIAINWVDPLFYVAALCLAILLIGFVRGWKLLVIPTFGLVVFIYVFMIRIADVFFPVTWFF